MQRLPFISDATLAEAGRWIVYPKPNERASLRLFCFPYAGGGSAIFRKWPDCLLDSIEVGLVQLPGRESRLSERAFTRVAPLVNTIARSLYSHFDKRFAFFGHSMGAIIAFELARELRRLRAPSPDHLIMSGRGAPQLSNDLPTYNLPDPEFLSELKRLNGTPKEVFRNAELIRLMLPLVRADFELIQTYAYSDEPPLDCVITALGGLDDHYVSREELEAWKLQTTNSFRLQFLPGDHFFINTAQRTLLELLSCELNKGYSPPSALRKPQPE
jgi:medium-chain acyl-[acyl-carrier-protein] hydrolase